MLVVVVSSDKGMTLTVGCRKWRSSMSAHTCRVDHSICAPWRFNATHSLCFITSCSWVPCSGSCHASRCKNAHVDLCNLERHLLIRAAADLAQSVNRVCVSRSCSACMCPCHPCFNQLLLCCRPSAVQPSGTTTTDQSHPFQQLTSYFRPRRTQHECDLP